jgi:thiamine biosynthesis protein ThiI
VTEFLVKYGEISLKGANRAAFEQRLMRNIVARLPRAAARARRTWGRVFVTVDDRFADAAGQVLAATFGVVSFARVLQFPKAATVFPQAADAVAAELAAGPPPRSFKVEARREDKSFSLTSYDIACLLGDLLRERLPEATVDVRRPQVTVNVEVRDRIYAYAAQRRGPGGLPVGSSGGGLLLLSGGIDSPVAGYLMGGRGLAVDRRRPTRSPPSSPPARRRAASRWRPAARTRVFPLPRMTSPACSATCCANGCRRQRWTCAARRSR